MFEGPSQYSEEDQMLPEPFDYLSEVKKMREEREARAEQKKIEREEARRRDREERLGRQLARSASKREESFKKLQESKADVKEKTQKVKEEVADTKKELVDIEKTVKEDYAKPAKTLEMKLTNGSEYTDADLKNGNEAIFNLSESVQQAEQAVDVADAVLAQAEALTRARNAIEGQAMGDSRSTSESTIHRAPEKTVYDLGAEQDQLKQRIEDSWITEQPEQLDIVQEIEIPPPVHAVNSEYDSYASTGQSATSSTELSQNKTFQNETHNRPQILPGVPNIGAGIRNSASFAMGLFGGRRFSRNKSLSKATESLQKDTSELRQDVEKIQQAAVIRIPEFSMPAQDISTNNIEKTPILSPTFSATETTRTIRPEQSGNNAVAIPAWIRQLESEVKKGKAPEIKKWQRDILRVQHPDILKKYEKLDQLFKERIKGHSVETIHAEKSPYIKPLSVFDSSYETSRPSLPTPMPAFMQASAKPTLLSTYTQGDVTALRGESLFISNFATIILVGGVIFGSVLILAFGF